MGEPPLVSSSHWVRIWESPACGWDTGKQSKLQNDSRAADGAAAISVGKVLL